MPKTQSPMASLWSFTPGDDDADVEAMPARVTVQRNDDDRVIMTVRGKPRRRYESSDSVWLEFTHADALRLIEHLASALGQEWQAPR